MRETAQTEEIEGGLTTGYPGRIFLLLAASSLTIQLGWFVIPPLLPAIIDDLGITGTMAGLGLTVLTGLAALARYPGGRLADQLSRKTIVVACLVAAILGSVLLTGANSYPIFIIGAMLVGVGVGAYTPAAFAQISDLFESKQGRALGVNTAAFNLAGIVAPGLAVATLAVGAWRLAFLPIAVALCVLALLFHRWNREEYVIERASFDVKSTVARVLTDTRVRSLLVVAALYMFVWNGSMSFLPVFLQAERGLSSVAANAAYASVFVSGVIVTPIAGVFGDRFGNVRAILTLVGFTLVGITLVIVTPVSQLVFVGVLVFAVGLTGFWPVMASFMMNSFPEAHKGSDYGVVGAAYYGLGSLGPTYVGFVGDTVHYTAAYAGFVGILIVCLALIVRIRRS